MFICWISSACIFKPAASFVLYLSSLLKFFKWHCAPCGHTFSLNSFFKKSRHWCKITLYCTIFLDSPKDIGTNDFQDVQESLSLGIKLYPRTKNMKRGGSRLLQSNFTFFFFHQLTTKLAQSLAVQLKHFIALPFHLLGTVFELQCKYHNCYVCKYHVTFP